MSQLLMRIDEQLRATTDPGQRAELLVRRACHLVRVGRFEEAERILAEVRASHGDGNWPRVSCWLMLTEGVLENYKHMSPKARDRIARAQLISVALKLPLLAALTSAWKAHIDFELSDFTSMSSALRLSLQHATDQDHEAHARSAMVISDCLFLCGDRQEAQKWFLKSRHHALEAGDQATIDALLYNRAAFAMAWLRAERCFSPQDQELISRIKLEIASARNFQDMTRMAALTHFVHLCEARIQMLGEDFEGALGALKRVRDAGPFANYNFSRELIDLDMVYCLSKLGKQQEAVDLFRSLPDPRHEGLDVDDRLVATWLRYELATTGAEFGSIEQLGAELEQLRREYRASRETIRTAVETALQPPSTT